MLSKFSGFSEEDLKLESHFLYKGPVLVADLQLNFHMSSKSAADLHICGSWYSYYYVKDVVLRDDFEQHAHYFDRSEGTFKFPVSGLYTFILGDQNICDRDYVIFINDIGEFKGKPPSSFKLNSASTRWISKNAMIKIAYRGSEPVEDSSFKITIFKH